MARMAMLGFFFLLGTASITMSARLSAGQAAPAPGVSCTDELIQLVPCLSFLTNSSVNTVVPACCDALKNVSSSSPICLCQLVASNSNQSAQLGINDTRALQLPGLCSLSLSPASCAALLGPSAAPAPLRLVPASAPAPFSIVPAPAFSPLADLAPVPAPDADIPLLAPESSASPGPAVSCNSEILTLQDCLTYLNGAESSPSSSCCTNLGSVVSTAPQCLCALAGSPAISSVNATLLQRLPVLCSVPASLNDCAGVGAPSSTTPIGPGGPPGGYGVKSASSSVYTVVALAVLASAHAFLR